MLSLDSAWETAILQLEVLHQLEEHTDRRMVDTFDWIVASGAGALLVMAMVYGVCVCVCVRARACVCMCVVCACHKINIPTLPPVHVFFCLCVVCHRV